MSCDTNYMLLLAHINLLYFTGIPFPIIVAWAIGKLYYENEQYVFK